MLSPSKHPVLVWQRPFDGAQGERYRAASKNNQTALSLWPYPMTGRRHRGQALTPFHPRTVIR